MCVVKPKTQVSGDVGLSIGEQFLDNLQMTESYNH